MLVEDHPDFRHFMTALLGREPDIEVVAQAGSLAEARSCVAAVKYDVVVLDLGLPDGNGVDLIGDLREFNAAAAVLILSASLHPTNLKIEHFHRVDPSRAEGGPGLGLPIARQIAEPMAARYGRGAHPARVRRLRSSFRVARGSATRSFRRANSNATLRFF
jgi:CheY-like chemotaxis protein